MTTVMMLAVLTAGQAPAKRLPPLAEPQLVRLRELVRTTGDAAKDLRVKLAKRQRELAAVYADFEFDAKAAERLQADIVDLQKQLLANYHHLQVELRAIVGKERFAQLKRRIDAALSPKQRTAGGKPTDKTKK